MPTSRSTSAALRGAFQEPLLGEDEERALALRFRTSGDTRALDRLVTSHMRLVAKIASRYRSNTAALDDLVSEGAIGLLRAARRFDPDRGLRFLSYARWSVEAQIRTHVRQTRSIVTPPRRRPVVTDAAASTAGSRPHAELNLAVGSASGRRGGASAGPDQGGDILDRFIDPSEGVEEKLAHEQEFAERKRLFARAVYELSERERYVLTARQLWEVPPTLDALGKTFGISPERVRQIEGGALKKVELVVRRLQREGIPDVAAVMAAPPIRQRTAEPIAFPAQPVSQRKGSNFGMPASAAAKPA
jgi:RNA polymerase sigma-32 factor